MPKIRWGVLGAARIATVRVIPAMQRGSLTEVTAIASRDPAKAAEAARQLGIPKAYGSYEDLLADPEIDAVYNPLPNHLHVSWSARAARAGKHVLCEKPVGMNAAEARELISVRDATGVTIGEAFMIQTHPQWVRAVESVRGGAIGTLRAAYGSFGYYRPEPENIRNIRAYGGGGLMDVGCYPIKTSRLMFGEEPVRVSGALVRDPDSGTDTLASAILEFPSGHCVFTCATRLVLNQSMQFLGTTGRIDFDLPFNPVSNEVSRMRVNGEAVEFPPCDQYTIQGDAFARAILEGGQPPVPLEDSLHNMKVIDALFRAGESGRWENVE